MKSFSEIFPHYGLKLLSTFAAQSHLDHESRVLDHESSPATEFEIDFRIMKHMPEQPSEPQTQVWKEQGGHKLMTTSPPVTGVVRKGGEWKGG